MFTGIIEETGTLKGLSRKKDARRLKILTRRKPLPLKEGDSLSVNGTCLTLVGINGNMLFFDIMEKTFKNTSFMYLKPNSVVNIERSLEWKGRLEGHFVLGHIDGVRKIKAVRKEGRAYMDITITKSDRAHIAPKGSVAIDGASLTVGDIYDGKIRVHIIPYTLSNTNLKYKKAGDPVNIEFDILGKYVKESTPRGKNTHSVLTGKFLNDRGFI